MAYDAGSAVASYKLDISDVRQRAAELRTIFQGIQTQASSLQRVSSSAPQFGPTSQNTSQVVAYANAQARLVQVQNTGKNALTGLIQAEQIYKQALTQVNANSVEAIRLQTQLSTVQNRIANISGGGGAVLPRSLENFGPEALQQIQSGLLGVIGPAALVTTAFSAVGKAIDLTEQSFKLKAALDTTNLSIKLQLQSFRDVNQTLADGKAFADRYNITQRENAEAIQASIPLLRQSKASLSDVEGVLTRLSILKPEQGIQGAAFALAELEGGQSRSLATRFNIPIAQATELKNRILQGGDAIQVMGQYLDSVGIGMDTLATRTEGATGKMLQLEKETENFQLALGGQAGGPGLAILEARIAATKNATRLLSGDTKTLVGDFVGLQVAINPLAQILGTVSLADDFVISKFNTIAGTSLPSLFAPLDASIQRWKELAERMGLVTPEAEKQVVINDRVTDSSFRSSEAINVNSNALSKERLEKLADQIETDKLAQQQSQLDRDSRAAAQGLLGAGNQAELLASKYGIAASQAQFLITQQQALSNATALADQRIGERDPSNQLTLAQFNNFDKLSDARAAEAAAEAKRAADKAKADAKSLKDAQNALDLAKATNKEQKIAVLQRQLAATTDPVERLRIQAQIEQEKRAGRTRIDAAASTGLQLQNVEENSQAAILKAQREGQERLRDQEQDFLLRRTRSKEDEERKIQGLLARGQRAAAARERADFALQQKRDQEDFNIQRQRTLRNNRESTGDITAGAERRQGQIEDRAALRGVKASGSPSIGGGAPPATLGGGGGGGASSGATVIQINVNATTNLDGQAVGNLIFDTIHQRIDETIALDLRSATPPGGNQSAVAGARP